MAQTLETGSKCREGVIIGRDDVIFAVWRHGQRCAPRSPLVKENVGNKKTVDVPRPPARDVNGCGI
jgi:hypothetical protein